VANDEGDLTLADDVDILNLGAGHSYGMLGLHVRLKGTGSVILASDAIYQTGNYGPPARLPGAFLDGRGYTKSLERIRRLAQRHHGQVWFGHDLEQFSALRKSTEGYYD
jgi:glyoxylase-like metal-dependent hydrolase (beta-lactamase superfamily II)